MTYTKMVDRLHEIASVQSFPTDDLVDAADAIKVLQAENERLTRQCAGLEHVKNAFELQMLTLQAKLDVLQTQEPVAVVDANDDGYWADILPDRDVKVGQQLFAAPKAPTHEQVEAAWRAGWAACRDAEYVGQEAEDDAWGMSQTCANADWENAAPKALEPLTEERIDELEDAAFRDYMEGRIDCYTYAVARAIEAAHGITKGTP